MIPWCILPLFCSMQRQGGLRVCIVCKITWTVLQNVVYRYFMTTLDILRDGNVYHGVMV